MLAVYVATSAPSVTFWDSGEFIAAARTLGIPHPPGTPLFVVLLNAWARLLSFLPYAVATNLLSAVCTAAAVGLTAAWIARMRGSVAHGVRRDLRRRDGVRLAECDRDGGVRGVARTRDRDDRMRRPVRSLRASRGGSFSRHICSRSRIPLHASALVAAPVAIYLATARAGPNPSRRANDWRAGCALAGVAVCAIGLSRLSIFMMARRRRARCLPARSFRRAATAWLDSATVASMLLVTARRHSRSSSFMLLRARHDPAINQGNPSTWQTLAARDRAPAVRRAGTVAARGARSGCRSPIGSSTPIGNSDCRWGPRSFPRWRASQSRCSFAALGLGGARWHRRNDRRGWFAVLLLFVCGSLGVIVYLNLKAGTSFGWQFVPSDLRHEARERDYFFVLGFWAWGIWAGMGAIALARRMRAADVVSASLSLRCRSPSTGRRSIGDRALEAGLPREVARGVARPIFRRGRCCSSLATTTRIRFGTRSRSNDLRRDVTVVTLPLLGRGLVRRRTGATRQSRSTGARAAGASSLSDIAAMRRATRAAGRGRGDACRPKTVTEFAEIVEGYGYRYCSPTLALEFPNASADSLGRRSIRSRRARRSLRSKRGEMDAVRVRRSIRCTSTF